VSKTFRANKTASSPNSLVTHHYMFSTSLVKEAQLIWYQNATSSRQRGVFARCFPGTKGHVEIFHSTGRLAVERRYRYPHPRIA
jgi:hypothetical protein